MRHGLSGEIIHGIASVVFSVAIAWVGAWLLVLIAGTVALLAVLLAAGLYVPLRCRRTAWRRADRAATGSAGVLVAARRATSSSASRA